MKTTTYIINVVGTLWSGPKGAATYAQAEKPSKKTIYAKAGDFQSVDDFQVIKIESDCWSEDAKTTRTVTTRTVMVHWDKQDSERLFNEIYNLE